MGLNVQFEFIAIETLLEAANDGFAIVRLANARFVFANRVFARLVNRDGDDLKDAQFSEIFRDGSCDMSHCRVNSQPVVSQTLTLRQEEDSNAQRLTVRFSTLRLAGEEYVGLFLAGSTAPSVDGASATQRLDPLTGLPDRKFLIDRLAALLDGTRLSDSHYAVLFVDVDNFKQINDQHGHLLGDRVLQEVARRLVRCVRDGDCVTRFGGDEFVVLLEGVTGRAEIQPIKDRIHRALFEPIVLPEACFQLSLSIGVAEASPRHATPEEILSEADREMYLAKRAGSFAS